MAKVELLAPKIFKWEGGFVDDPKDHGGATNMGVTLSTWRNVGYDNDSDGDIDVDDIRKLTRADATIVLKKYYWDRWRGDEICRQSVADILVDWVWCSGRWGIVIPQRILKLKDDGIVGPVTIQAVCNANQQEFHGKVFQARLTFLEDLVRRNPTQARFLQGWKNRLNDFKFF